MADIQIQNWYETGTEENDTVTGREQGDWFTPGEGDDTVDLLGGEDTVNYAGSLYTKNFLTGQTTLAFKITKDDNGVVTVEDLYGNEGTDTLTNVERLYFNGDQVEVRLVTQYDAWMHERWFWDANGNEVRYDVRMINARGSAFDDEITGEQGSDHLSGGDGNDIILADGDAAQATLRFNFQGGNVWSETLLENGVVTLHSSVSFDHETVGHAVRVPILKTNGEVHLLDLDSSYTVGNAVKMAATNGEGAAIDLAAYNNTETSLSALWTLKSTVEANGGEIQFWVDVSIDSGTGRLLIDLESPTSLYSDDEITGEGGNDFIDGGAVAWQPTGGFAWRGNEARYEGNKSDYVIAQIEGASDLTTLTTLLDGSSINDFLAAAGISDTAANFAELLTVLGVKDTYVDGSVFTLVADTVSDRDGIDILKNIQQLSFSDGAWLLEARVRTKDWGEAGKQVDGAIVDELIDLSGESGFDHIDAREGNDIILAGAGGDWVRGGGGNDFADGGADGDSNNQWDNRDRFSVSGDAKRYIVEKASASEAASFLANNFATIDASGIDTSSGDFFFVTDRSPYGGSGTDLITGFERIDFNDTGLDLVSDIYHYASDSSNSIELDIRGTSFDDLVDAAAEFAKLEANGGFVDEQIALGTVDSSFNKSARGNLGDGNDIYIGGAFGDRIELGTGNDIYFGGGGYYIDNYSYLGEDEVRYNGRAERFELIKLDSDFDGVIDGVEIDLSDVANGNVTFDGTTSSLTGVSSTSSFVAVRDLLPSELGGLGVDLLIDPKALSFNDSYINVGQRIFSVRRQQWLEDPNNQNGKFKADIGLEYFGGKADFTGGLAWTDELGAATTVHNGYMEFSRGNDDVLGFRDMNEANLVGGGNDFFNAISTNGEDDVFGDPWDYFDRVRLQGNAEHYSIREVYLDVGRDGYAARGVDGNIIYQTEYTDGLTKAIEVVDLRPGNDKAYLVGVERIQFADNTDISVGITYRDDANNIELDTIFAGIEGFADRNLAYGAGKTRIEGSPFSDVIIGRDAPDYSKLTDHYFKVELGNTFNDLIAAASRTDGDNNPDPFIVYKDVDGNGSLDVFDSTSDSTIWGNTTFAVYVDTQERATALQTFVDSYTITDTSSFEEVIDQYNTIAESTSGGWQSAWGWIDDVHLIGSVTGDPSLLIPIGAAPVGPDGAFITFSRFDNGSDEFVGGDGADLLIGLQGGDQFRGGAGDDIFDGGSDALDPVAPKGNPPWAMSNNDIAQYSGASNRYLLDTVYVLRDADGWVIDESNTQLANYVKATAVTDTLSDELGGTGRDILIDIERVRFEGDGFTLWLTDSLKAEYAWYHPLLTVPDNSYVYQLQVWDRPSEGSTIDATALYPTLNHSETLSLTSKAGYAVDITGQFFVRASAGTDVITGIDSSADPEFTNFYYMLSGEAHEYDITRLTDSNNETFVRFSIKDGVDGAGKVKSADLYDMELAWFAATQERIFLQVAEHYDNGSLLGAGSLLSGSYFDDQITAQTVVASVDSTQAKYAYINAREGDDIVSADGAHSGYVDAKGDDYFDGGSGIDFVSTATDASQLQITYFEDDGDGVLTSADRTLDLATFRAEGINAYYTVESNQLVNPSDGTLNAISYADYAANASALNISGFGFSESGAGWVEFNSGYYISVTDLTGDAGLGSDVYTNVEALMAGDVLLDLITGQAVRYADYSASQIIGLGYLNDSTTTEYSTYTEVFGYVAPQTVKIVDVDFATDFSDSSIIDLYGKTEDFGTNSAFTFSAYYNDQGGDSVYEGSGGLISVADGSALEVALLADTSLDTGLATELAKTDGVAVNIQITDIFRDGAGDDIYIGGGNDGALPNINGDRFTDTLSLNGGSERYTVVSGVLDAAGKIDSAQTANSTLLNYTGTAGQQYLIIKDNLAADNGGDGENLAVDIDKLFFEGDSQGINYGTLFNLKSDAVDVLRAREGLGEWGLDAQSDAYLSAQHLAGNFDSLELDAAAGDAVYVGLETTHLTDSWDLKDKLKLQQFSITSFDLSTVWVAQDADGDLIRGSDGEVTQYSSFSIASAAGASVEKAVVLDGSANGLGKKVVIDYELVMFSDAEYTGDTAYRARTATWNEQVIYDDDSEGQIESFGAVNVELSDFGAYYHLNQAVVDQLKVDVLAETQNPLALFDIDDGQGDDVIIIDVQNYGPWVRLTGGDDFVHFTDSYDADTLELKRGYAVRINESSERFDLEQVYVKLTNDGTPETYSNGSVRFYEKSATGVTAAVRIQDLVAKSSPAYLGEKLVIGADRIRFSDTDIQVQPESWKEDWDGDGVIDMYTQRGSSIDEVLSFDSNNPVDARDRLEGQGGDDVLIGGAGGDRLRGGAGDDVLIGGANGTTQNTWENDDTAEYWPLSAADLHVERVVVGFNESTNEVLRDPFGTIIFGAVEVDLKAGYELIDAITVTDLTGAYGTDLLIRVERIQTQTGEISASVRYDYNDWDNDGVINQVYVRATDFDDTIGDLKNSNSAFNYENGIDAGRGDDNIYAGVGGDWIRPGAGVDFVDAGANGQLNEWGWVPTDSVQFEGDFDRYIINNITFTDSALDITDAAGTRLFSVDSSGLVVRASNENEVIFTLKNGQTLTTVEDLLPNLDFLDGDGFNLIVNAENLSFQNRWLGISVERNVQFDDNGNPMWGWMRGTLAADEIVGSAAQDHIQGAEGDDILIGLAGDDHFEGGAGDDLIYGDKVSQVLSGNDHVRFSGNSEQFVVTKKVGVVDDTNIKRSYFEVIDLLPADIGGSGTDILVGIESISFDDKWVRIGINRWDHTDSEGVIIGSNFEGSDYGDVINGTALGDHIRDRDGNDTLYGNDGADYFEIGFGDDTIYGGAEGTTPWGSEGVDVARFSGNFAGYSVTYFDANGGDTAGAYDADGYIEVKDSSDGGYGTNRLYGIERLEFDNKWINLEGYANGTYLVGSDDDDELNLSKNWGDSVDYRLEGGEGNDVLHGWSGNDLLTGDAGSDTLYGRDGADVAIYTSNRAESVVAAVVGTGTEEEPEYYTVTTGSDVDKLYDIERIKFADSSLSLVEVVKIRDFDKNGDFETAIFTGKYSGTTQANFDTYFRAEAAALNGGPIAELATTLNYIVSLGEDDDSIVLSGGNDQIYWSAGDDTIDGGAGTDEVIVNADYGDGSIWDLLSVDGELRHYDTNSNLIETTSMANIERVAFNDRVVSLQEVTETLDSDGDGTADQGAFSAKISGSTFDASAHNANLSWTLFGSDGNDTLDGGSKDDVLSGGLGTNTLDGGDGYDIATYDYARADFNDPSKSGAVWTVESNLSGVTVVDTLANIEALRFTDGLFALEATSELVEEFVFGQGRVQTQVVRGTTFGENLEATATSGANAVNVSVSGGIESATATAFDQFIVDVTELNSTRILDFEVADSGGNRDLLTLLNSDFTTVSQARDAFSVNENGDLVLISNGGELILEGLTSVDQSELNISLDIV